MEIKDFSEDGEKHHRHHHHHHHHHRSRKEQKRRKWIRPAIVMSIVVVVVVALALTGYIRSRETFTTEEKAGSNGNVELRYKDVSYQGEKYKYNNRITTILLAGLDSEGPIEKNNVFADAPRSDTIMLLIIDTQENRLSILAINRDTMTDIRKYTLSGSDRGLSKDHIGNAYAYGDGEKISAEGLREATSLLLYDVPVNHYLIVNRSVLKKLAETLGPVNVTVPNNDLIDIDTKYAQGNVVTVDDNNIELFVRNRDTSKDFSNTSRMERQNAYINAAMDKVLELLKDDPSGVWKIIEGLESTVLTDITRSQYLDIVNDINKVSYDQDSYYTPEGTQSAENLHDEFYVDERALLDLVVKLFYRKQ